MDATRVDAVQQPPAVRLPPGLHDRDRLRHPGIRGGTGPPEVVQRTKHVVVPVVRERELQVRRLDDRPVLMRRNRPRSSRYSSPLRRAVRTCSDPPAARSNSARPSSTLIVVSKEDRTDPLSASQFQPPSASCSGRIRSTTAATSTPKYAPVSIVLPLMQGSTSPSKN